MATALSEHCIYTIVHADLLAAAERQGGAATFSEAKPWVICMELWQRAQKAGVAMPVLLGDATDCSQLLYWGQGGGEGGSRKVIMGRWPTHAS
jgi:hypothetical protein